MILGRPKGRVNFTCSLSNRYYENQEKNPPDYYSIFEFVEVPDDYLFVPALDKYDRLEKVCYLFHHKIVRYYIEHNLDPDTPWWWFDDPVLHEIVDKLAQRIKDTV